MKKLRIILLFSIIVSIILIFYRVNKVQIYDLDITEIKGVVKEYNIDGNKLNVVIDKYKITYYFKSEFEKNNFVISYGDIFKFSGVVFIPKDNTNFNLFNYKLYLKSKKIDYIFTADEYEILSHNKNIFFKIKNIIKSRVENSNSSTYLKLFLLGNKEDLEEDINSTYSNNGISHLFAISGMHISLLSSILFFCLNNIIKNKKINNIVISLFLILFSFITSFSPSVLRATFMFIFCLIFKKINPIYILTLIFIVMTLYNPFYIYNMGFLYSFVVSFCLILFSKKIKCEKYIFKVFKTSFIAFLCGIPISISNFHEINLLSPFFNIVFVPFVSFIIFPLSIITFIFPMFSNIFNFFTNIMENLSIFFDNISCFRLILKNINLLEIIIYYLIIIIVIYKDKFRYYMLFLLILIIHSNLNYFNMHLAITMIDVGQGDSILIELPHNKGNVLIDTGGFISYEDEEWKKSKNSYSIASSVIIPYLKSIGIKKIDYLILSHGDSDHMGEAINLFNEFKVDKVVFNCGEYQVLEKQLINVLDKNKIKYFSCIEELNIDKYKLQFLNTGIYDNENDNSSVIYLNYNNYKFLFMGDASITREKDILEKYNLKNIDFLKVGHHGSNTSSSEEFINSINPKYSLISVGKNNRYGHPKDSVLDTLSNSYIYRTDIDGSIEIKLNKNGYKISTCPP